jgi:hypothetical protein
MRFEYHVHTVTLPFSGTLLPPTTESGWRVRASYLQEHNESEFDPGSSFVSPSPGCTATSPSRTISRTRMHNLVILWERTIPERVDQDYIPV